MLCVTGMSYGCLRLFMWPLVNDILLYDNLDVEGLDHVLGLDDVEDDSLETRR